MSSHSTHSVAAPPKHILKRKAKDTLTAVELDVDDELHFQTKDGRARIIRFIGSRSKVIDTNIIDQGAGHPQGVTRIWFSMHLVIDGFSTQLTREIGTQQSFYEPRIISGLRIWPDAVREIFDHVKENHGRCAPSKQARFAIQDATMEDCPVLLHPWCPLPEDGLRIENCYSGMECWMGAYFGTDAHGGLDINHPAGTSIWAPIAFDDHYLFDSTAEGANNNRWRGIKHWANGATWILQCHHIIRLLVPERQPLDAGVHYAEGAGVRPGFHEHSHFVFAIEDDGERILLDPWILFWKMYRDRKATLA